jgi:hypothetical protein
MTGEPPTTKSEALDMLIEFIKGSTSYQNPQTVADGFVVELVTWLEDHPLPDSPAEKEKG